MNLEQWSLEQWSWIAQIIQAVVACAGFLYVIRQLRQQNSSSDSQAIMGFNKEVGDLWEKYRLTNDDDLMTFYLGQILVIYESMCFLFLKNVLSSRVEVLLKDHIIEVMASIIKDNTLFEKLCAMKSGDGTYEYIVEFFRKHSSDYKNEWAYLRKIGWAS